MDNRWDLSIEVGKAFEYDRWVKEIPWLAFPSYMQVKVIPPFHGAVVRFLVQHKDNPCAHVSVYLDCYDVLWIYGEPYWEIYPYHGDVARVPMWNAQGLMRAIEESLREQVDALG